MTLEQQVCSLDLAKRLKELGVKQEGYFSWYIDEYQNTEVSRVAPQGRFSERLFSAFTVAELGELLYRQPKYIGTTLEEGDKWRIQYDMQVWRLADTEADARAKMLIYLLEKKLITL